MKKIFSLFAAALLIAACTPKEEVGTPFQAGQKVTLAASMGTDDAEQTSGKQRVSGVDNGTQINLTWDEGDQITVKVGDATAVFTLESGAGSASATFTGTMPAAGSTYQVSYPANYDESVLANQTYVANGFSKGLMKMSTKSDGTLDGGFVLSADNALVAFNFTGEDALSKIVLTNPAASKNYTLGCTGVTLNSVAKVFYFVIPAGTWPNGFTVEVYDAGGNVINSFTKEGAVDFSATSAVDMPEKEVEPLTYYEGRGTFSVSATKQVTFSPGNLQYHPANNVWQFAANQTDYIGFANTNISSTYNGWIDLFGWSTSTTNFGVSTSTSNSDYSGSFIDWGTNKIGNDAPNTWRTLTSDEWEYLRNGRPNASSLLGVAQVNGVNGLIFLPDNWTCPAGVTFKSGFHSENEADYYAVHQTFTAEQWSQLEAVGAVFLPAAGYRVGLSLCNVQFHGFCWSATENASDYADMLALRSDGAGMYFSDRYCGSSVRLVKDIEGSSTPETPGNVENGHEYVDLGLSVKWATCNVGANAPEEYGDYFAWGEVEPKSEYTWATYKWYNGTYGSANIVKVSKYSTDRYYGVNDGRTLLELKDDAAAMNWGGAWRMPTKTEINELENNCNHVDITINGVKVRKFTSKINGNSIMLPAAGRRAGGSLNDASSFFYWSSSLNTENAHCAFEQSYYSALIRVNFERYYGFPVRPVCP